MDMTNNTLSNPGFSAFKMESQISFIRGYDPKAVEIAGYRHSVVRYRDTTKGVSIKPAKMVTIPALVLPDEYSLLSEKARKVFHGVIEDTQDNIIRGLIDEGKQLIEWKDVTLDSCLDSLTAIRVSTRLTKDQIEGWARAALHPMFMQRAVEKISSKAKGYESLTPEQACAVVGNAYIERFGKLSAPVPNLSQEVATALSNLLKQSQLADDISQALGKKLHAMLNPTVDCGDL